MVARGSIAGLTLLVGCQAVPVSGFQVVGSVPAHGDNEVVEALVPELRLNAKANFASCSSEFLVLVPVDDDGGVAFELDYQLTFVGQGGDDEGMKVLFQTDMPLVRGYHYDLFVRPSEDGCVDEDGRALGPFGVEFFVP